MNQSQNAILIDAMLDPLSRCLDVESSRLVVELQIDPAVQQRVEALAIKANDGLLTADEQTEYEAYINTADFIGILKLKAQHHLKSGSK